MTEQENVKTVKKLYEDFNKRDMDACWAPFADDLTWIDPFGNKQDKKGMRAFYDSFLESFPDLKVWANRVISQGNTVVAEFYESMTHKGEFLGIPPTNKKVEFQGVEIYEFQDGKVKHVTNYCNPNRIIEYLKAE